MLSVEDPTLFPVKTKHGFYNKASAIMKYVTEGIAPDSTIVVPELNRFFYTLFQEYSSMLRKEYMYLNGQRDFYNASEYKSILESEDNIVQNTFNKKQNCFSWILANLKQETLIEKFIVLMMRYLYLEGAHVKEEFHQDYESIFRCSSDTEKLRVLKNLYSSVASHLSLHKG
jgi:succinate dehydrogenase flavin-adding protein (antitoxin of CptAB toxin-antitoxin module)